MKKVFITLGFAAATIMAANAQDIPATEEQPQNTVQTQPAAADETLDTDTQLMDDQAVDDTYNNETIEPSTQTVRDEEINDMPTEPLQDDALNEAPSQEESVEGELDEPIDEMQEDVVEMQGEDPNAQSTMHDVPDAEDQSYSSTQEGDDALVDPDPITNPSEATENDMKDQPVKNAPNDGYENNSSALSQVDQANMELEESVSTITEADLPEEVTKALGDSEYAEASIVKVYVLEGVAVDKLMQNNAEKIYAGQQNPDKIYQVQVQDDEGQSILYYDENGDLLDSARI